jgi:hypothetical protein
VLRINRIAVVGFLDALDFSILAGVLLDNLLNLGEGNLGEEGGVEPGRLDGARTEDALNGLFGRDGWLGVGEA